MRARAIHQLIRLRGICLLVAALFFFSGHRSDADPVGDFFKKLGQSMSKAFQPQPTPRVTRKTRSSQASPGPSEEPSKPVKQEVARTVLPASAAPADRAKEDMPYGIPVSGQKGLVTSPYLPEGDYIDVRAFAPGSAVKDPYTGKIFRVP